VLNFFRKPDMDVSKRNDLIGSAAFIIWPLGENKEGG
jgi:hypothetical protein